MVRDHLLHEIHVGGRIFLPGEREGLLGRDNARCLANPAGLHDRRGLRGKRRRRRQQKSRQRASAYLGYHVIPQLEHVVVPCNMVCLSSDGDVSQRRWEEGD